MLDTLLDCHAPLVSHQDDKYREYFLALCGCRKLISEMPWFCSVLTWFQWTYICVFELMWFLSILSSSSFFLLFSPFFSLSLSWEGVWGGRLTKVSVPDELFVCLHVYDGMVLLLLIWFFFWFFLLVMYVSILSPSINAISMAFSLPIIVEWEWTRFEPCMF